MIENNYRIHRIDHLNIAIQKWVISKKNPPGYWRTVSYHGNSPKSLLRGLSELIMSQHTPNDVKLSEQLVNIELALISGIDRLEKMIKETVI